MTDIEPRPASTKALQPLTGEVIDLAKAPTDQLAEEYRTLTLFEQNGISVFKRAVATEILARMDREGAWTAHLGNWDVSGDSPDRKQYGEFVRHDFEDGEPLRHDLLELVEEGVLSADAVDRAVEVVTVYKIRKKGLNALLKIGGRVKDVVLAHERQSTKPRYVRVTEKPR